MHACTHTHTHTHTGLFNAELSRYIDVKRLIFHAGFSNNHLFFNFQTTNNNLFGNSWLYEGGSELACVHDCDQSPDTGDCPEEIKQEVDDMCDSLLDPDGRFKVIWISIISSLIALRVFRSNSIL